VAWLQKRNGDYFQSLNTYLSIIEKEIDLLQLMKDLITYQKQQQMALAMHEKLV
jgi:hypothetical protein